MSSSRNSAKDVVVVGLAALLLLGAAAERLSLRPPADATPYHDEVRAAAKALPMRVGDWVGTDVEQPQAAVRLLRPNVIFCRRYDNMSSDDRQEATFLLVQCPDARDLVGHFPPICYPNQGWKLLGATPTDWTVGGVTVHGTRYEFLRPSGGAAVIVRNFMILPDGRFAPNMDAVDEASKNVDRRFYGAAQVQVTMDSSIPEQQRNAVFNALVAGNWPVIEAIRSGAKR
jgi:hypothetical protein